MADFSIQAVISASFQEFVGAMESIGSAAEGAMARVSGAFTEAGESSAASMAEIGASTKEAEGSFSESFASMRESAMHLIEVLGVIEGLRWFKEGITSSLEFGERMRDMSVETGISTQHLQELQFAAQATGVDFGRLVQFAGQLTRAYITLGSGTSRNYTSVLAAVGLKPSDLSDTYTALQKISGVIQKFGEQSQQARAVLATFGGRGGLELAPMLAKFDEFTEEAQRMGLVLSSSVLDQLDRANESFNVLGAVIQVDKERIAAALTPVLEDLARQLTGVAEKINELAQTGQLQRWAEFTEAAIAGVIAQFARLAALIAEHNDLVGIMIATAGAMALSEGRVAAGLGAIAAGWELSGSKADKIAPAMAAHLNEIAKAAKAAEESALDLANGLHTNIVGGPEEGGGTSVPMNLGGDAAAKAAAKAARKLLAQHRQQLSDFRAEQAEEVQIANNTAQAKITAAHNVYEEAVSLFGAQSREAHAAATRELSARNQYLSKLKSQDAQEIGEITQSKLGQLSVTQASLNAELSAHKITKSQELAGEQNLAQQTLQIHEQQYSQLAALYAGDQAKLDQVLAQKIAAENRYAAKVLQIQSQIAKQQQKTDDKITKDFEKATQMMANDMNRMVDGLLAGNLNMEHLMGSIFEQILSEFISMTLRMVAQWLASTTLIQAAWAAMSALIGGAGTGMMAQKSQAAQLAGANMIASWSAAPWPIDAAAPAMGAMAMAAALSMAGGGVVEVPSAFGGMAIPATGNGNGPGVPAILHARETVLPANLSQGFQNIINRGGGGDTHHFETHVHVNAIDSASFEGRINEHAGTIADAVVNHISTQGGIYRHRLS